MFHPIKSNQMKKKSTTPVIKMKAEKKIPAYSVGDAVGRKVQEIKKNTKVMSSTRENNSILFRHLA
jgi:hypothetical protein